MIGLPPWQERITMFLRSSYFQMSTLLTSLTKDEVGRFCRQWGEWTRLGGAWRRRKYYLWEAVGEESDRWIVVVDFYQDSQTRMTYWQAVARHFASPGRFCLHSAVAKSTFEVMMTALVHCWRTVMVKPWHLEAVPQLMWRVRTQHCLNLRGYRSSETTWCLYQIC